MLRFLSRGRAREYCNATLSPLDLTRRVIDARCWQDRRAFPSGKGPSPIVPVIELVKFDVRPERREEFLAHPDGVLDAMRDEPMFHQSVLHADPGSGERFLAIGPMQPQVEHVMVTVPGFVEHGRVERSPDNPTIQLSTIGAAC